MQDLSNSEIDEVSGGIHCGFGTVTNGPNAITGFYIDFNNDGSALAIGVGNLGLIQTGNGYIY